MNLWNKKTELYCYLSSIYYNSFGNIYVKRKFQHISIFIETKRDLLRLHSAFLLRGSHILTVEIGLDKYTKKR